MNHSSNRLRGLASVVAVLAMCLVGWALLERAKAKAALEALQRQLAATRAELAARDRYEFQAGQLDVVDAASLPPQAMSRKSVLPRLGPDLSQRLADLTAQQSNLTALVQRFVAKKSDEASQENAARGLEAALKVLQTSAQQNRQQLEAAKQRAAELLSGLNIPPEISTMDAGQALDTASLRDYWPFFEAKRERDSLQDWAERLRMRMIQERVDGSSGPAELETLLQEGQQQLAAAKQRAAELLRTLNVPTEISTLDASKALDTANLGAYWPFFQAKREREVLQEFEERLRRRLIQEQVDAAVEAARKQ